MKLQIGVNISPMNGYTVIDPVGGDGKISMDFRNLDSICEASECTEIRATEILGHIHGSELIHVIQHWVSKLRHGGKIIIGGFDMLECCKSVMLGHTSVTEANQLFYGMKDNSWSIVFGMYECNEIVGILMETGLKIDKKRINGNIFVVEAHRE